MNEIDGEDFEFHDERTIFFCRGVLETVRKLGWAPDVVHCHGWMSGLVPMYLKKLFQKTQFLIIPRLFIRFIIKKTMWKLTMICHVNH